jgi:TrmH RNA methyltransferase
VSNVILPNHPQAAIPTEATYRVAEGALDHVNVYSVDHLPSFVNELRQLYWVVGAASHGGDPRIRPASPRPISLVLGNEEQGLSREITELCNSLVTIPGSNLVESLNVSAAAAVLLWEITRDRRPAAPVASDRIDADQTQQQRPKGYRK